MAEAKRRKNDTTGDDDQDMDDTEYNPGPAGQPDSDAGPSSNTRSKASGSQFKQNRGRRGKGNFRDIGAEGEEGVFPETGSQLEILRAKLGNRILALFKGKKSSAVVVTAGIAFATGVTMIDLATSNALKHLKDYILALEFKKIDIAVIHAVDNAVRNAISNNGKDVNQKQVKIKCTFDVQDIGGKVVTSAIPIAATFNYFNKMTQKFGVTFSDSMSDELKTQKSTVIGAQKFRQAYIKSALRPPVQLAKTLTQNEQNFPLLVGVDLNGNMISAGCQYMEPGAHLLKAWTYKKNKSFGADREIKNEKGRITYIANGMINKTPAALKPLVRYVLTHPTRVTEQEIGEIINLMSFFQCDIPRCQIPFSSEILLCTCQELRSEHLEGVSDNICAAVIWKAARIERCVVATTSLTAAYIGVAEVFSAFGFWESSEVYRDIIGVDEKFTSGMFCFQSIFSGREQQTFMYNAEGAKRFYTRVLKDAAPEKAPKLGSNNINTGIDEQPGVAIFSSLAGTEKAYSGIAIVNTEKPITSVTNQREFAMLVDKLYQSAKKYHPIVPGGSNHVVRTGYYIGLRKDTLKEEQFFDPKQNPMLAHCVDLRLTDSAKANEQVEIMSELFFTFVSAGGYRKVTLNQDGTVNFESPLTEAKVQTILHDEAKHSSLVMKRRYNTFGIGEAKKRRRYTGFNNDDGGDSDYEF